MFNRIYPIPFIIVHMEKHHASAYIYYYYIYIYSIIPKVAYCKPLIINSHWIDESVPGTWVLKLGQGIIIKEILNCVVVSFKAIVLVSVF